VERNPFPEQADTEPKRLLVTFLSARPKAGELSGLDPRCFEPESFQLRGREIYSWHPGGMQRSRLGRALAAAKLGVSASNRNWNTVTKLLEPADAA